MESQFGAAALYPTMLNVRRDGCFSSVISMTKTLLPYFKCSSVFP